MAFILDIEKDVVLSSLGRSSPHCATGGLTKVTKLGEAWSKTALKVLLDLINEHMITLCGKLNGKTVTIS